MIRITPLALMTGAGCPSHLAQAYIGIIQAAMDEFGISQNYKRIAAFLANVGEESEGLQFSRESMNYSAEGLARTWRKRYANVDGTPNMLAKSIARNPVAIANNVYANRLGNGNDASGDGWKYRGVGWIQTTGKTNITQALVTLGFKPTDDPAILTRPELAARSAALFWWKNGCNAFADKDMFSQTVKVVNGQLPCPANEGHKRLAKYRACVALLKSGSGTLNPVSPGG